MKFIYKEETENEKPTFGDVQMEQLFICHDGFLSQKVTESDYNMIADPNGKLCAGQHKADPSGKIQKIFTNIKGIQLD